MQKYLPILKAKEGEFKALESITSEISDNLMPLFEFTNFTPLRLSPQQLLKRKKALPTIDTYLEGLVSKIIDAWVPDQHIFIDTHLIPTNSLVGAGLNRIQPIFEALADADVAAVPVIHTSYSGRLATAFQEVIEDQGNGMCLRLNRTDLASDDLDGLLGAMLERYEVEAGEVDLILDFGAVTGLEIALLANVIALQINALPHLNQWRTLTVASSAFPLSLSSLKPDTLNRLDRNDWNLWKAVAGKKLKRKPFFGDYVIANPEMVVLDFIPDISASLRYTGDEEFIVLRGKSRKKHGSEQTHALATTLVRLPDYSGEDFSEGDDWFMKCSTGESGPGSPTTWRQAGSNHHFHKVIEQLASLRVA